MRGVVNLSVLVEVAKDALLGPHGVLDHDESLVVSGWMMRTVEIVRRGMVEVYDSLRALGDGPAKRPRMHRGPLLPHEELEALVREVEVLVGATRTVEGRAVLAMRGLLEFEDHPFAVHAVGVLGNDVKLPWTVCKLAFSQSARGASFVPVVAAITLEAAAATLLLGLAEDFGAPPVFALEPLRRVRDGWVDLVTRLASAVTLDEAVIWTARLGLRVDGVGFPTIELTPQELSRLVEDALNMVLCGATLDAACRACRLVAGKAALHICQDALSAGSGTRALLALRFPNEPHHDEGLVHALVERVTRAVALEAQGRYVWRSVVFVDDGASLDLGEIEKTTLQKQGLRCRLVCAQLPHERPGVGALRCAWDKLGAYQAVALSRARRDWNFDPHFLDSMAGAMATHGLLVSSREVRGVLADYMGKFCVLLASGRCARVSYQKNIADEVDQVVRVPQSDFGTFTHGNTAWARLLADVLPRECGFGLTGKTPEEQNRPKRYCDLRGHTFETSRSPLILLSNPHGGLQLMSGDCRRVVPVLRALWLLAGRSAATTERLFRVLAARLNHLDSPCFPTLVLTGAAMCKTKRTLFVDLLCHKILGPALSDQAVETLGKSQLGPGPARLVVFDACKHAGGACPRTLTKTREMDRALVVVLADDPGEPDLRPRAPDKWYVRAAEVRPEEDESCSAALVAVASDEATLWAVYKVFRAVHDAAKDPDRIFHELPLATWPPTTTTDPEGGLLAVGQAAATTYLADKREKRVLVTREFFDYLTNLARLDPVKTAQLSSSLRARGLGCARDGGRGKTIGACVDIGPALAAARATVDEWSLVLPRLATLVASPVASQEWQ